MTVDRALLAAIRASRGVIDGTSLESARSVLAAPWRVAVIGRTSAGKSSFVNRRTGARSPVGLGGVTRRVEEVPFDGGLVLDTPGIDDPDEAVLILETVLETVDAAVWVVDGLQPMTASERAVVETTLPPGMPLWVVVAKLDLVEPEERDSVLQRVRSLAAPRRPIAVQAFDLRTGGIDAVSLSSIGRVPLPGPRRAAAILDRVAQIRAALASVPFPPHPDEIRDRWRQEVRAAVRGIEARIAGGGITHQIDAIAALSTEAPQVVEAVVRRCGAHPPRLPLPDPPARTVLDQMLASLSGAEGARRAVRAAAARWLAEGEWALDDGWSGAAPLGRAAVARRELDRALAELERAARV